MVFGLDVFSLLIMLVVFVYLLKLVCGWQLIYVEFGMVVVVDLYFVVVLVLVVVFDVWCY